MDDPENWCQDQVTVVQTMMQHIPVIIERQRKYKANKNINNQHKKQ